jgi:dsDNA-specific endonuclease/ATPase MutS2
LVATLLLLLLLSWLGRRLLAGSRSSPPAPVPAEPPPDVPIDQPIGDELDLHGVPPPEVTELVEAFIDEALARGRLRVRIVHGKGTGVLRARVRAILAAHPGVLAFADAPPPSHWGATVVELHPPAVEPESTSE